MKDRLSHFILTIFISSILLISCNNSESTQSKGDITGITETEIKIGAWGPLSGPAALWGNVVKGSDAYFKMINDEGGIHGRKINFIFKDDAYDPSRTVPAVRELVQKDEIFAVAGGIGTATNMAVASFLEENNVPWVSPMSGSTYFTEPVKSTIFTTYPLYFDEGQVMINYISENMDVSKFGIIYQNDDFGKSGLVGAKNALADRGLEFAAALPVEVTDTDLSSHIARLKDSGAEAVLLWVLPRQAAIILGSSAVVGYKPNWFASIVLSDMSLMHNITKGAWEGVYFNYPGEVMPNDESNAAMMKYKAAFEKYYPEDRWGSFPAAGFMWVETIVEGLDKAGKDLTRESFIQSMNEITNFTGGSGVPITYTKDNHLGTRSLAIMKCTSAEDAEKVTDFISSTTDIAEIAKLMEENE